MLKHRTLSHLIFQRVSAARTLSAPEPPHNATGFCVATVTRVEHPMRTTAPCCFVYYRRFGVHTKGQNSLSAPGHSGQHSSLFATASADAASAATQSSACQASRLGASGSLRALTTSARGGQNPQRGLNGPVLALSTRDKRI